MILSKEWTDYERRVIAAVITTECRNAAMMGEYPQSRFGNSETAAVVLTAPSSFLETQRSSLEYIVSGITDGNAVLTQCWQRICSDIEKLFPGTFSDESIN